MKLIHADSGPFFHQAIWDDGHRLIEALYIIPDQQLEIYISSPDALSDYGASFTIGGEELRLSQVLMVIPDETHHRNFTITQGTSWATILDRLPDYLTRMML